MENKFSTELIDKAIAYAIEAHKNVFRKGNKIPYIIHATEAMVIVSSITDDQEMLSAAVLHDVIEDCNVSPTELEKVFNKRIVELVLADSDRENNNQNEFLNWKERKIGTIERIRNLSIDGKIVVLGDKLSNMRAIYKDYKEIGDKVWDKFTAKNKNEIGWYYLSLVDSLKDLEKYNPYQEFKRLAYELFK